MTTQPPPSTQPPARGEGDVPSVLRPAPSVGEHKSVKGALGRQLIGRILMVCLSVGLLVSALSYVVLNRSFDAFERAAAAETLNRVQTVLRRDSQDLSGIVVDYAYWDDLYAFMSDQRDTFMDENFTVASMRNLQVHAAVVFDLTGDPLATRMSQGGNLQTVLPPSWMEHLTGAAVSQGCMSAGHALIWAGTDALSVAFAPVRNSAVDKPSRGCFVLVRHMDSAYRASVAELAGVEFSFLRTVGLVASQDLLPNGNWYAQSALTPWPASLSIENPPSLVDERRWIMALMTGGQVVLLLSAVAVLYALLHRMVVRRLTRFSSLADTYRQTQDWTIAWPA
ncbi:MAG: hypothetical protein K2W33_08890, partial [Burkholderiales bacterium]|nr:hypothetical protein [Burkholderiales bacterium]